MGSGTSRDSENSGTSETSRASEISETSRASGTSENSGASETKKGRALQNRERPMESGTRLSTQDSVRNRNKRLPKKVALLHLEQNG